MVTNPATGQIAISRHAFTTNTVSSDSWRAHTNWFVFVENESRVWCYDGQASLDLLSESPVISAIFHGPCPFPCKVPEQVRMRLSDAVRRKITTAGK
jgi:hypothetical protein